MPISVAERIAALLDSMSPTHLDALPPARLRQLAASMRHWSAIADARADRRQERQHGVLGDLQRGQRQE